MGTCAQVASCELLACGEEEKRARDGRVRDAGLVVGAGYGIDGYGLGKFVGIEVMVHQTDGQKCKFIPDVQYSIAGWLALLKQYGAKLPSGKVTIYNLEVGYLQSRT